MKNSASGPKKMVSPTPVDLAKPSAFLAIPRGSRVHGSPVVGSSTSHTIDNVVSAKNGSIVAVAGSGIRHMSDSWIAFQPAIDEPSNIWPSANVSSSIIDLSKVTCCHLPRGSVKRKSTYFTSLSFIIFRTSLAVVMGTLSCKQLGDQRGARASDGIQPGFPRSDPDGFLDIGDEDLAVSDPAGLRSTADRIDGFFNHVVS